MISSVATSSPVIVSEFERIPQKHCSHQAAKSQKPCLDIPLSRNPIVLQRIANQLDQAHLLNLQTKQDVIEVAANLLNGNLEAMRRITTRFQRDLRQFHCVHDTLSTILMLLGETAIQVSLSSSTKTQATSEKNEIVILTFICTQTKEAISIPSHPELPVWVYRMTSVGPETKFWHYEKSADARPIFQRMASFIGNTATTTPPLCTLAASA